ncbi:MAG: 30S ribosomal protein S20 [Verrucomicrobiota bacterium]
MPNVKSAEKRVRQTKTRTERHRAVKAQVRSLRKKVRASIEAGDQKAANEQFSAFASAIDKAAKSNVFHKNTAARLKQRLNQAIAQL